MTSREDKKEKLRVLARESKKKVDEILVDELQILRAATTTDLEKLRPKVTDEATYDKVISAVGESTRDNESKAQLKQRVVGLGSKGINMVGELFDLLGDV